jgi:hypothetical protein
MFAFNQIKQKSVKFVLGCFWYLIIRNNYHHFGLKLTKVKTQNLNYILAIYLRMQVILLY